MPSPPTIPAPLPAARPRFGRTFWMLNTIEMWERLAYYNLRVMAPIYIMQADDPGGLKLTAGDKGTIYAWWAVFQSLLPIATGGFADRFGYKRVMAFAISTMMVGYLMLALLRFTPDSTDPAALEHAATLNYWSVFASIMVLATGTAFFKPGIQGSLAKTFTKETSSVGWGVFYWIVNVGSFIGHYLPGIFLGQYHTADRWRNLFLVSAGFTALNLFMLMTYKDVPSGADKTQSLFAVLKRTIVNIVEPRLVVWLLLMSGFWLMMFQLWDLLPNVIKDWVDSAPLVHALQVLPEGVFSKVTEVTPTGIQVQQQVLLSLNSLCIICGVIGVSWVARRMRTLTALLGGMGFAIAGILLAGWTTSVWTLLLGILCFSLGEMTIGPKTNEYLALIAPADKKGLYLGYANIPAGLGILFGSKIAGYVYGHFGEKAVLAQKYLLEHTPLGQGRSWDGNPDTLGKLLGVDRADALARMQDILHTDAPAATRILWELYDPQYHVWIPFAAVGIVSALGLWVFGRMARRWSDMNA